MGVKGVSGRSVERWGVSSGWGRVFAVGGVSGWLLEGEWVR